MHEKDRYGQLPRHLAVNNQAVEGNQAAVERLLEAAVREKDKVTMQECGLVLDMVCRVIYPCSYTIFIATIFAQ